LQARFRRRNPSIERQHAVAIVSLPIRRQRTVRIGALADCGVALTNKPVRGRDILLRSIALTVEIEVRVRYRPAVLCRHCSRPRRIEVTRRAGWQSGKLIERCLRIVPIEAAGHVAREFGEALVAGFERQHRASGVGGEFACDGLSAGIAGDVFEPVQRVVQQRQRPIEFTFRRLDGEVVRARGLVQLACRIRCRLRCCVENDTDNEHDDRHRRLKTERNETTEFRRSHDVPTNSEIAQTESTRGLANQRPLENAASRVKLRVDAGRASPMGTLRRPAFWTQVFIVQLTFRLGGDLPVNRLGFGAMRITGDGVWGPPANRAEAIATLRRAIELGVTLVDTAESYGPYVSESLIAEALHPYPSGLVIATKGGFDRSGPDEWEENGNPERLRDELDGSLRRLRLDRIDLYQLHRIDPAVPEADQFGFLQQARQQGKIRHVGLSEVTVEQIERARRFFPVASVQNRYNLVDREWETVLDYCEREHIAFMPWSPLQAGEVAKSGWRQGVRKLLGRAPRRNPQLASIARRHNATPSQVALAWLLRRSPVMLPIPGTSQRKHLEENVAAAAIALSDEEYAALT
jgi:pyridoxine 4-dehydrogenase